MCVRGCGLHFVKGKSAFDANVVILKGNCEVTGDFMTWGGVLEVFEIAPESS